MLLISPALRDSVTAVTATTAGKSISLINKVNSLSAPNDVDQPQITKQQRSDILASTLDKMNSLPPVMIIKSSISLFSWEEMQKIAGPIRITNTELSGTGSVNDPRMGLVTSMLPTECQYCGQIDCCGHYGLIEFGTTLYNPAFIREIIAVLSCVCNDCGGLLITEDIICQKGWMHLSPDKKLSEMEDYCKGVDKCLKQNPHIGNGIIIPCDSNPVFSTTDVKQKGEITYKRPSLGTKKITKEDPIHIMSISTVMNILNRISENDARLLGFPIGTHPRNMIMQGILVIPTIARPPVFEGGNMHHDKLSHMYVAIKRKVDAVKNGKSGAVNDLYSIVKQLIFKTDNNKIGLKGFRSIIEMIQGKTSLLRGLMMGKRGDYCARTVASPDPSLEFGQIRLPKAWAHILTKRVTVTNFNIKELQNLLKLGQISHVISKRTGLREYIGDREDYKLELGTKVERWLQNGDRIIINRQPTLHRQSKMAYEVVLGDEYTIGLHLSYTTPMNCDFDGDENNAWLPRNFEVEAEAEILLNVKNNTTSSEQNRPSMGLVMNSITSAFLMTKADCLIDEDLFQELLNLIKNKSDIITLNDRLLKWGVAPFSGAAIFSAMLPADFYYNQKNVIIVQGILISGRIKKSAVGVTHRSIIQELHKNYDIKRETEFFTDAPWILNKWIMESGFSVGLLDMLNLAVDPETNMEYDKNQKILTQELTKIYTQLEVLGTKFDDPLEENYRIRKITNLSDIANAIGIRLANDMLITDNSIGVMTEKGAASKGTVVNICQMTGAVGQQFIYGERIQTSITGGKRALPCFDEQDNNPEAHGFIPVSFFTGLSPEQLFFLQAGGREGLLNTSLSTQDTGSLSHKMIKAFENITIGNDGSIRNTIGTMFSPIYNSGYCVGEMMNIDLPGKTEFSSFVDIKSLAAELNIKRNWIPQEIKELVNNNRTKLYPDVNYKPEKFDIEQFDEKDIKINRKFITKFEKSRIIGARAQQLLNGDEPLIDLHLQTETDPIKIALQEYDDGLLEKLYIIRKFPDGTYNKINCNKENINCR